MTETHPADAIVPTKGRRDVIIGGQRFTLKFGLLAVAVIEKRHRSLKAFMLELGEGEDGALLTTLTTAVLAGLAHAWVTEKRLDELVGENLDELNEAGGIAIQGVFEAFDMPLDTEPDQDPAAAEAESGEAEAGSLPPLPTTAVSGRHSSGVTPTTSPSLSLV